MPQEKQRAIVAPNEELKRLQVRCNGSWYGASKYDVSEIQPSDFKTLRNMRPEGDHIAGTSGYTVLNASALTETDIKAGIQLRTDRVNPSYVFVASNLSGTVKLYQSTTAIPNAMTFSAVSTGRSGGGAGSDFSDTSGNEPRLAVIPQKQLAYSNENASYIYAGNQMDCAAFFLCDDTALANPRDYWEAVRNTLSSDTVTVAAASTDVFTVHSTRPLQGVWFTVSTPNASASTLTCHVWTTAGWVAVSNASDGTTDTGIAFAQSGEYVFDSTVSNAARKHFENTFFYCYRFQLSAGSAVISHVQVDAPFQQLIDVWDGVPRNAIYAGINFSGDDEDFTAHVIESSTVSTPIGMLLDGLTSSDEIYFIFEERTAAIQITMLSNLVNDAAATLSGAYWNGSTFTALSNFVDGTLNGAGTKTFKKSGLLSWEPPAATSEFPYTIGKVTGYCYRFVPSATLTGTHGDSTDSVVVDVATGIPAPMKTKPYKFHGTFKNRHMGLGAIAEKEGNRIDFTAPFAPDVWNGFQSSMGGLQSIYLGSSEELNCSASLYNRIGSLDRLFEIYVVYTDSHIYQIKESAEEDMLFEHDEVSNSVGCPAPKTLTPVSFGVGPSGEGMRNVHLFLDSSGPYMYDGSQPVPVKGIERYFDPNDSLYVGADLSDASAWINAVYREWNLILPGNVWLALCLENGKWYQKDPSTASCPNIGFTAIDTTGHKYSYGGLPTGEVVRLEYGTTFDGASIIQEWESGDFWPSQSLWDQTRLRMLKFFAAAITETHSADVIHHIDTQPGSSNYFSYDDTYFEYDDTYFEWPETSVATISLNATSGNRLVRKTISVDLLGWCHSVGMKLTTSDAAKGLQAFGWAAEFIIERSDH